MKIDKTRNTIEKYTPYTKEKRGAPPDLAAKKFYYGVGDRNRRDHLASHSSAETLIDSSARDREKLASSQRMDAVAQALQDHCKVVQRLQQMYQKIKQKRIIPSSEFIKRYNESVVSLNAKSKKLAPLADAIRGYNAIQPKEAERYPELKLPLQLKPLERPSKDGDPPQPHAHVEISGIKDRSQLSERESTLSSWDFNSSLRGLWDTLKPIGDTLKELSPKKLRQLGQTLVPLGLMSLPLLVSTAEARRISGQNYTLDIGDIERPTLPWPFDKLKVERRTAWGSAYWNASLDPLAQNLNTTFEQIMQGIGKECIIIPEYAGKRPPTARQLKQWREKQCDIIRLDLDRTLDQGAKVFPKEKRILLNPELFEEIEKPIQTYEQWLDTAQGTFTAQLEHLFPEYPQLQGRNVTWDAFKNLTGQIASDQFQTQEKDNSHFSKADWVAMTGALAVLGVASAWAYRHLAQDQELQVRPGILNALQAHINRINAEILANIVNAEINANNLEQERLDWERIILLPQAIIALRLNRAAIRILDIRNRAAQRAREFLAAAPPLLQAPHPVNLRM